MKKIVSLGIICLCFFLFASCNQTNTINVDLSYFNEAYQKLLNNKDFKNIKENFSFPSNILVGEEESESVLVSKIISNNVVLELVNHDVIVHQDNSVHSVCLTITLTYNSVSVDYRINAIVLAYNVWDEIEDALHACAPDFMAVENNLNLITSPSKENTKVIWNSNNPNAISSDGLINIKFGVQTAVLTAMLYDSGKFDFRLYTFKVVPAPYVVTDYKEYEYYMGGGTDIYSAPINLLNNQIDLMSNSFVRYGYPSISTDRVTPLDLNVIVVPVEFTNSHFTATQLVDIQKCFFGTKTDTGWESVASYYNKSSFGKINYNGVVTAPFNMGMSTGEFQYLTSPTYAGYWALNLSLDFVVDQIGGDITLFDVNQDGYLDGICFIYAPKYVPSSESIWWAHKHTYYAGFESFDDIVYNPLDPHKVRPSVYMWASQAFMYDSKTIPLIAETYIHENGHMFGLPDYYDYDSSVGTGGGLGGADMMDHNIGDHGPFSKIILGWIVPQVITETITVKLYNAPKYGQALIIPYFWKHSFFSEYLLVDFYAPEGLFDYDGGKQLSVSGVRIYHVNADLGFPFMYNNSYTSIKLIGFLSANSRATTGSNFFAGNQDLFQTTTDYDWDSFLWNTLSTRNPRVRIIVQEKDSDYCVISVSYVL